MDGIHDLGGRQGFGPVVVEPYEPVFHEPWEALARALLVAVVIALDIGSPAFRHAIERMDPEHYLTSSYYEHWLTAAATMAVEGGLLTIEELADRAGGSFPISRPVRADPAVDPGPLDARFAVGDRVRVREWHPRGHTRCPDYVRGHVGVVTRYDVTYCLPDLEAHSTYRTEDATYSVRFDAEELWRDGQSGVGVNVDMYDSYLEAP